MYYGNTNYAHHTDGQNEIHTLVWNIRNFVLLLRNNMAREFRSHNEYNDVDNDASVVDVKTIFQLKMLFVGKEGDLVEIYYLTHTPMFAKTLLFICLKHFEERSIIVKEYQSIRANKWQYLTTLFKRDIDNHDGNDAFLFSDGSLRLKFEILVSNDVTIIDGHNVTTKLTDDFENLLNDGTYSDITMKSIDGEEFRVHKLVLAIRSEVLKAHFEHNTKECTTNIIETPWETEVLREVLTFVYTDKAPEIDDMPEQLLAAADYYQLGRLKYLCEVALHKKLTVENAIDTLQLAELHTAKTLKQLTLEFIKDGQANLITHTEAWKKMQSVEIIKKIYEFIMSNEMDDSKVSPTSKASASASLQVLQTSMGHDDHISSGPSAQLPA